MGRVSILGMLLLVMLFAIIFAIMARLREEALVYVGGPILGSLLAAWAYRRDGWAFVKGGAIGGLCQGLIAVMILKRGYVFEDRAMMTGGLFLATLAVHLLAGLGFGTLLSLALRQTLPRHPAGATSTPSA